MGRSALVVLLSVLYAPSLCWAQDDPRWQIRLGAFWGQANSAIGAQSPSLKLAEQLDFESDLNLSRQCYRAAAGTALPSGAQP